MKHSIKPFIAFIILVLGIAAMIMLTGAAMNTVIKAGPYLFWMAVSAIVLHLDAGWIDKHFVDGEWI